MSVRCRLVSLCLLFAWFGCHSVAQQPASQPSAGACAMPVFNKIVKEPNIFSEQQEEWLGEIMDMQVRQDHNVVDHPEGYL